MGIEAISIAAPDSPWSSQVPCRTAAIMPIGTPMSVTQIIVMVASKALVSAPSAITDSTGAWKKIDRPRLPSSTWPVQVRYCRMIG